MAGLSCGVQALLPRGQVDIAQSIDVFPQEATLIVLCRNVITTNCEDQLRSHMRRIAVVGCILNQLTNKVSVFLIDVFRQPIHAALEVFLHFQNVLAMAKEVLSVSPSRVALIFLQNLLSAWARVKQNIFCCLAVASRCCLANFSNDGLTLPANAFLLSLAFPRLPLFQKNMFAAHT